jgi:multidrug efflux pump subunit AcrA (membrane-fusion protein)
MKYMGVNKKRALSCALAAAMLLTAGGCAQVAEQQSTAQYIELGSITGSGYRTAEAYTGDFEVPFSTNAQITCLKQERLYWENSEDRYGDLMVQEGQEVKKGDVLATFEVTSVSDADILERELAIQNAETSLAKVHTRYQEAIESKQESLKTLTSYEYQIAELELEKLKSEYAQQVAETERQAETLRKSLQELRERKEGGRMIAPFDGRVQSVSRSFQKGNKVVAYETLIVLEDTSSRAICFVNNSAFGTVPYLSKVELYDKWAKKSYTGTVVSCAHVTGQKMDEVVVQPDDAGIMLADSVGFLEVTGNLIRKSDVILVDSKAVKKEGTSYYVFVLGENNSMQKVYISVGGENAGVTWVTEGLEPGQTVVLE